MRSKSNKQALPLILVLATTAIPVTSLTPTAPCHAECPPRYEVTAVVHGLECGPSSVGNLSPWRLSESGHIAGTDNCPPGYDKACAWYGEGLAKKIPMPPGTFESRAYDINNGDWVIGEVVIPDSGFPNQVFRYHYSSGLELVTMIPEANAAIGLGTNNQGDIVGYCFNTDTGDLPGHAFLWRDGAMVDLNPELDAYKSFAYDISDNGEVVGFRRNEKGTEFTAFLWDDDGMIDLGPIPGGYSSEARAINNVRQVIGRGEVTQTEPPGWQYHAFFWSDGEMIDLGTLPLYQRSLAYDINDASQVVGHCTDAEWLWDTAFLWMDGEMWELDELLVLRGSVKHLKGGRGINNSGQILAAGVDFDDALIAVLLTPVDVPPTDLNCDCVTDVLDLLILLEEWAEADSPADFNADGVVDVLDLLILLAHWG